MEFLARTLKCARHHWRDLAMIAVALVVFWITLPLTFGVKYFKIRSPDGRAEAYLERKGGVHYTLVVHRDDGKEMRQWLPGFARPERIFWFRNGDAIGLDYGNNDHRVIYVTLRLRCQEAPWAITEEEEDKAFSVRKRMLSDEEEEEFEFVK